MNEPSFTAACGCELSYTERGSERIVFCETHTDIEPDEVAMLEGRLRHLRERTLHRVPMPSAVQGMRLVLLDREIFMVEQARILARRAHHKQLYGDKSMFDHVEDVVEVLLRFCFIDPTLIAAAYLHDAIEDTWVTEEIIEREIPRRRSDPTVAEIVNALTDGVGRNRAARKQRPYRLIPLTPGAIVVKLADRIANIEHGVQTDDPRIGMYVKEHDGFVEALQHSPGLTPECRPRLKELWEHLDWLVDHARNTAGQRA